MKGSDVGYLPLTVTGDRGGIKFLIENSTMILQQSYKVVQS